MPDSVKVKQIRQLRLQTQACHSRLSSFSLESRCAAARESQIIVHHIKCLFMTTRNYFYDREILQQLAAQESGQSARTCNFSLRPTRKYGFTDLMIVNIVVLPVVTINCGKEDGISEKIAPKT